MCGQTTLALSVSLATCFDSLSVKLTHKCIPGWWILDQFSFFMKKENLERGRFLSEWEKLVVPRTSDKF